MHVRECHDTRGQKPRSYLETNTVASLRLRRLTTLSTRKHSYLRLAVIYSVSSLVMFPRVRRKEYSPATLCMPIIQSSRQQEEEPDSSGAARK